MANQRAANKKGIGVYIDSELHAAIKRLAQRRGITLKQLIEEAATAAVKADSKRAN